jgi:isopentenyl-diphosphate delta-isomerase type 2
MGSDLRLKDVVGQRKGDHVRHAVEQYRIDPAANDFDAVVFVHHALDGIDSTTVDLSTVFGGKPWRAPLYVNGMTGGSQRTGEINRELAIAAAETGIAIGSGSMSAYFADASVADSFRVLRQQNPHGFVMANVNANAAPEKVRHAIDLVDADALQIHLNAVQETVMPEGDRSFGAWPRQIEHADCAASTLPATPDAANPPTALEEPEMNETVCAANAHATGRPHSESMTQEAAHFAWPPIPGHERIHDLGWW